MALKTVGNAIKGKTGNLTKGVGGWAIAGTAMNVGFGVSEYRSSRQQGSGKLSAATKAVGEGMIAEVVGFKGYLALGALKVAPKAIAGGVFKVQDTARKMNRADLNKPFANATFVDTQEAYTMRQAGMQMAKNNRQNREQSMLGNEAQHLHM